MMKRRFSSVFVCLLFLLVACSSLTSNVPSPDYWPSERWRTEAPAEHDFDRSKLARIEEIIQRDLPFLDGLLIIRDGYIVHERYFNGYEATTLHDVASVAKSWTSALVGMARAKGKLSNLDAKLPDLLPGYFSGEKHADKREITLRNLLMMRSGIAWDEELLDTGVYGGEELLAGDLTAIALTFPMAHPPGTAWNYSTLDVQLISAIFEYAMGQSLEGFAEQNLFSPLGITSYEWLEDGTGTTVGGQNLSMTPRDMAKLGLLYLHGGEWAGEQLIPEDWVQLSLSSQNSEAFYTPTGQSEIIEWYGYLWWTWKPAWFFGYRAF